MFRYRLKQLVFDLLLGLYVVERRLVVGESPRWGPKCVHPRINRHRRDTYAQDCFDRYLLNFGEIESRSTAAAPACTHK